MNITIVILNLLVSSISIAKPIEEVATSKNADENIKMVETVAARNSEVTEGTSSILINKDDVLSRSDLSKIYNTEESLFSQTRYLKEQQENEGLKKAEIKEESRTAQESKSAENLEDKSEERSSTTSKIADIDSKTGSQEESKSVKATSALSELESTTASFKIESRVPDHLESVKDDENDKKAPNEVSERKSLEISNDESNSGWDLLDDIPLTRRMLSPPDNLNFDLKGKSDDTHAEEARSSAKLQSNSPKNDLVRSPVVSIPHIHPVLARRRFQIVPGFITIRTAVPIDFRRILSHERDHLRNQNIHDELVETSDLSQESRAVEDISSDELSNAYPYVPVNSEMPIIPHASPPNSIFAKLAQASEHPQRTAPNYNSENVKNLAGMPYINIRPNNYAMPQNYDINKYVTGFRSTP